MTILDQSVSKFIEQLFTEKEINSLASIFSYILLRGDSDDLAVKIAAQRIRWVTEWPDEEVRLKAWLSFKVHLDYWLASKDNFTGAALPTVALLGLDNSVVYFLHTWNLVEEQEKSSLLMGYYMKWQKAGWLKEVLSEKNFSLMFQFCRSMVKGTLSNRLYGNSVQCLKSFATKDNLKEILPYVIEAFESPRFTSDAHALSVFRNLVATYGEEIYYLAAPLFEDHCNYLRVKKDVEQWQKRTPNNTFLLKP
jgi:hypothetical protein